MNIKVFAYWYIRKILQNGCGTTAHFVEARQQRVPWIDIGKMMYLFDLDATAITKIIHRNK